MRMESMDDAVRTDPRGWVLRPFEAGVPLARIRECHAVSLRPGSVRGNHLHPEATEWMVLCGGPVTVAWRGPGGEAEREELRGDRPVILEFPPGTAHAVRCDSDHDVHLVAFSDRDRPETRRVDALL